MIEVRGAGSEEANGFYTFNGQSQDAKPIFKNGSGTFLTFKESGNIGLGWAIRGELKNKSLYHATGDSDLPPCGGWQLVVGGSDNPRMPLPTVQAFSCVDQSVRRKRSNVEMIQERAWKQRRFSDAYIVCNDVRTDVHRVILCAASPVFDAAFSSAMAEGHSAIYEIKDATPAVVDAMLSHIYTGVLQCEGSDLPDLFRLARQYELDSLGEEVAAKMLEDVSVDNVQQRLAILKLHRRDKDFVESAVNKMLKIVRKDNNVEMILALV